MMFVVVEIVETEQRKRHAVSCNGNRTERMMYCDGGNSGNRTESMTYCLL